MTASTPGHTNLLCDGISRSQLRLALGFDASSPSSAAASVLLLLIHDRFSVPTHNKNKKRHQPKHIQMLTKNVQMLTN